MRLIEVNVLKEWIENWFTKNRLYHPYAKNNNIPITELYDILEQMPSVQPDVPDTNVGDMINRQDAIDALCKRCDLVSDDEPCTEECNDIKILKLLPSAQQKPLQYTGDSICLYCQTADCEGCMYEPMEGVER